MNVTVFGTGYVGLVQGAVLADVGHNVVCVDVDAEKVARLEQGVIPIYEPGLEALVKENYAAGRLTFTTQAEEGVKHGEVQFIAVKVTAVVEEVLAKRQTNLSFDVVSNPEFLKEGSAVADCKKPDRIIIGTTNDATIDIMRELYAPFNRNHDKIITMDVRSAELTKYAANCMLATKISFMNEMANLAERLDADIEMVRQGIGSDPRIGYHFIYPGAGYGGSCFPKDVQALIRTAESIAFDAKVLKAVEERNQLQKNTLFEKINRHFDGALEGKVVALWGLAFKPNTDDMREAPSRVVMESLWQAGAKVQAYDPEAMEEAQRIYGHRDDLTLCGTKEGALKNADILVIVTDWQSFKAPDFELIKATLSQPVIVDGRNLFDPKRMSKRGITYYGVGR